MNVGWPDVVIGAVVVVAAIKGFARGLLSELSGVVAVLLGFAAGLYYNGIFDHILEQTLKLNAGLADVTGRVAGAIVVYGLALLLLSVVARIAKLPVLGTGNAIAGGIVGAAKGVILLWVVLFVALLFPLSTELRADLRASRLVALLAQQNVRADVAIYNKLPDVAKPLVKPLLDREHL